MTSAIPQTNFGFVGRVWPALLNDCRQAERNTLSNPVVSCFYSRRVLERVIRHIWEFRNLGDTGDANLFTLLQDSRLTAVATTNQLDKMHYIRLRGNDAVHDGQPISPQVAVRVIMQLFDVLSWATARHSAHPEAQPIVAFQQTFLKAAPAQAPINRLQLKKLAADLEAKDSELSQTALLLNEAEQERLAQAEKHAEERALFAARNVKAEEEHDATEAKLIAAQEELERINAERDAEIARLRAQLRDELAQQTGSGVSPALPPTISEAETRRDLIDPMLATAGFYLGHNATAEYPVEGMPVSADNRSGAGYVDYLLWDDDGQPLAVVEAKRSSANLSDGAVQARLYADCLEAKFGRRPIIFCTNGHLVEMTDDAADLPGSGRGYPTRQVEGYPTAENLRLMINRRTTRKPLATAVVDPEIAGRDYQQEMIRRVTESFENGLKRRALLVMATGTGKTRVAIAASKLLRETNWVGNVLFLADRTALVDQAHDNFIAHYPESAPVNLLSHPNGVGGVYVSTYQTMMSLINDDGEAPAKFRPFDFDLIIIDEAHRSIYHRFKRILDYFDAYVLGLTATPKAEVHRNTYQLFDIDGKDPTGAYTLEQAIEDKFLVPPQVITQDSLFLRSGVRYDDLDADEQQRWDDAEWGTDEEGNPLDPPDGVSPAEVNSRLYNRDTIRQVLKTLVTEGIKVQGGDRLGKTIIFARTQKHASLIKEEFDHHFPLYAGENASVITHSTRYVAAELKRFKNPASELNVAISVDMLDTGVDVPEVVNLVFFKPVYSATKFWQMMGRGTRLRPNLFGDGLHKDKFRVFDFCGNARFFLEQQSEDTGLGRQVSLSEKLFLSRVALLSQLDQRDDAPADLRDDLAVKLHELVSQVSPTHIQVRPLDRPVLEYYQQSQAWETVTEEDLDTVGDHLAHLPMPTMKEKESAKRFDLLILQLQLGLLSEDSSWIKNRQRVEKVADELLTVAENLPFVAAASETLEVLLDSAWWEGVTLADLEKVRRELRSLVEFVPRHKRQVVVLDVEDEFGEIAEVDLPVEHASVGVNVNRVEEELRTALAEHHDSLAMQKLRTARPLHGNDVEDLEAMIADLGLEGVDEVRESLGSDTIPAFVRRLVGLDENAMRDAFSDLLEGSTLTANQISFIRHVIKVLVNNGGLTMQETFDESFYPHGRVADLFQTNQAVVLDLKSRLDRINSTVEVS
ncbi:DEAD/DEAH box helicase family protein [Corynebacterium sanguinis]|uniref:DEAD/DEAH box helicase family protein n=1 Tax=Corynebacterium sanguinis TaxID=2594913 RepID=UPI0021AFB686|nr:DEAD/DEAH box helicase family protein [Corynebacterium sanguinis]MCT1415168.1 DEAD/DEAH box helicase family protein [Corynebacterium sanguinis]